MSRMYSVVSWINPDCLQYWPFIRKVIGCCELACDDDVVKIDVFCHCPEFKTNCNNGCHPERVLVLKEIGIGNTSWFPYSLRKEQFTFSIQFVHTGWHPSTNPYTLWFDGLVTGLLANDCRASGMNCSYLNCRFLFVQQIYFVVLWWRPQYVVKTSVTIHCASFGWNQTNQLNNLCHSSSTHRLWRSFIHPKAPAPIGCQYYFATVSGSKVLIV